MRGVRVAVALCVTHASWKQHRICGRCHSLRQQRQSVQHDHAVAVSVAAVAADQVDGLVSRPRRLLLCLLLLALLLAVRPQPLGPRLRAAACIAACWRCRARLRLLLLRRVLQLLVSIPAALSSACSSSSCARLLCCWRCRRRCCCCLICLLACWRLALQDETLWVCFLINDVLQGRVGGWQGPQQAAGSRRRSKATSSRAGAGGAGA